MECNVNVKPVKVLLKIPANQPTNQKNPPLQRVMLCKFYLFYNFKCVLLKTVDSQTLYMFSLSFIMRNLEMFFTLPYQEWKPFSSFVC